MANKNSKHAIACTRTKVYKVSVDFHGIRRRRKEINMSQTDAAKLAGWTQQRWAEIENGKRLDPRLSTLEAVANVLRCSVIDLLKESK